MRPASSPSVLPIPFRSRLHDDERIAAVLGIALGICFLVCFATGMLSYLVQQPPSWFRWPSRPAGLYRLTQGIHVATGIACIPLVLAKLWVVYPKLFAWPPFTSVAHALERVSLLPLIGGAIFLLVTGVTNVMLWYVWPFAFRPAHRWAAWITIGALVVHVGAKWTTTRRALTRGGEPPDRADEDEEAGLGRRGFLGVVFGTASLLTLFTVGQTIPAMRPFALLAARRPDTGPQGFPVNRSAQSADVVDVATSPEYRLVVEGAVDQPLELTLDELRALPQHEATLPIACVEGWSTVQRWRGVRVRDLLSIAGAADGAQAHVESLQQRGANGSSDLNASHAHDRDTLLALEVNGEPLALDHGFPCRLIGPNRPGVMQTKWVTRIVVT